MRSDRLEQLAHHLLYGELGHDKFDFGVFHQVISCGTAGCAIGECPYLWPHHWKLDNENCLQLTVEDGEVTGVGFFAAQKWFNLTSEEAEHLFMPNGQERHLFGGKRLMSGSSKFDVALNILAFIMTMNPGYKWTRKFTNDHMQMVFELTEKPEL